MSPERAQAYRQVVKMLDDLGPSKLLPLEQDRVRHAADSLIFSHDVGEDPDAQAALGDVEELCHSLVQSGRWEEATAGRLLDNLIDCGPAAVTVLHAA